MLFDSCPTSDDIGAGGYVETLNIEVCTIGCEFGCELGCEPCQSWSEPKISCFLRFLPVWIFLELYLSRFSVLPLFFDR